MRSRVGIGTDRVTRRGIAVAVLLAVVGAAAGFAYGHTAESTQEATAVVLVHPTEGNPFNPESGDDLVNLATEAELVTSDAVGRAVARQELGVSPVDVLADVAVVVPPNTQLLQITVRHHDGEVARSRAQTFADSYLDYRRTRTTSALFDRSAQVSERTRVVEANLADAAERLAELGPQAPERPQLEQRVDVLTVQAAQLRTENAAIRATAREPGEVVTPAAIAGEGPLAATTWATGAGALLGLAAAAGLAVARVRGSDRIDSAADLAAADQEVVGRADQPTEVRARILLADPRRPLAVLVAGTEAGSTPSADRARALAESFARARLETVHLDLAPQGWRTAVRWSVGGDRPRSGLLDVLHEVAVVDDVLTPTGPHLYTVGLGTTPPVAGSLADLVAGPSVAGIFDDLRKRSDLVIITGTDMTDPATHQLLAHVDLLIPWVVAGVSTTAGLAHTKDLAGAAGVACAGVVFEPDTPSRRVVT